MPGEKVFDINKQKNDLLKSLHLLSSLENFTSKKMKKKKKCRN